MGSLDVLRGILAKLVEDKFGDIYDDEQLCIATVVDPRFKLGPLGRDDHSHHAVEVTVRSMAMIRLQGNTSGGPDGYDSHHQCTTADVAVSVVEARHTVVSDAPQNSRQEILRRAFELYVEVAPRADCLLPWCTKNKATYPAVAAVVHRLLARAFQFGQKKFRSFSRY